MDQPGQQVVSDSRGSKVLAVYAYLMFGLLDSTLTVTLLCQSEVVVSFVQRHFVITMVLSSLLVTLCLSLFNRLLYPENKMGKTMILLIICLISGVALLGAETGALLKSAVYTTILMALLSFSSYVIPIKIVNTLIYPMTVLHTAVLICTIYSILFGLGDHLFSHIVTSVCVYGGLLVYALLLICNTQRVAVSAHHSRFDPIIAALVMYMNIINLFSRVATLWFIEVTLEKK